MRTKKHKNNFFISKKKNHFFLVILVIIFISFFVIFQGPIRSFFYSISQPLQHSLWIKGMENSKFWQGIFEAKTLKDQNEKIKKENQILLKRVHEIGNLKKENKRLRQALSLDLEKDFQLLETQVLSKNIDDDSVIINKGSQDGVKEKMILINYQKVFVGQVEKVYKNSSRVLLLTNPKMKFSVKVEDTDIKALVLGEDYGRLKLDLIPKEKKLINGALLTTIESSTNLVSNLLVGKINKIEKNDLNPFQTAQVTPFFNPQEDNLFFLITN